MIETNGKAGPLSNRLRSIMCDEPDWHDARQLVWRCEKDIPTHVAVRRGRSHSRAKNATIPMLIEDGRWQIVTAILRTWARRGLVEREWRDKHLFVRVVDKAKLSKPRSGAGDRNQNSRAAGGHNATTAKSNDRPKVNGSTVAVDMDEGRGGGWHARVPKSVYEQSHEVGLSAFGLFVALLCYADHRHGTCYPSFRTLRKATGASSGRLGRLLQTLKAKKWIDFEIRPGVFTEYTINWSHFATGEPVSKCDQSSPKTRPAVVLKRMHNRSQNGTETISIEPTPTNQSHLTGSPPPANGVEGSIDESFRLSHEPAKRGKQAKPPAIYTLPSGIDTPEVRVAFEDFCQHRTEIRKKLTPTAAKKLLNKLEAMGPTVAVVALTNSVSNGWTGVFDPEERKGNSNGTFKGKLKQSEAFDDGRKCEPV